MKEDVLFLTYLSASALKCIVATTNFLNEAAARDISIGAMVNSPRYFVRGLSCLSRGLVAIATYEMTIDFI